jgi:hypothetical protein
MQSEARAMSRARREEGREGGREGPGWTGERLGGEGATVEGLRAVLIATAVLPIATGVWCDAMLVRVEAGAMQSDRNPALYDALRERELPVAQEHQSSYRLHRTTTEQRKDNRDQGGKTWI